MRFEHLAFNVSDPVAHANWYAKHFSWRVLRAIEEPIVVRFVGDSEARLVLEFYQQPSDASMDFDGLSRWTTHLAFTSNDLVGDVARLVAAGGVQDGEVTGVAGGDRVAFVRDPWGLVLQLVQRQKPLYGGEPLHG